MVLRGIERFDSIVQPCKYSPARLFSLSRTLRSSERPFEAPSRVLQRTSSSFINGPPGSQYLAILTRDHDIPSPAPTAIGKRTDLLSYLHSFYCRLLPKALISTKMVPVQPESIHQFYIRASVVGGNRADLQNLLCLAHGMVAEQSTKLKQVDDFMSHTPCVTACLAQIAELRPNIHLEELSFSQCAESGSVVHVMHHLGSCFFFLLGLPTYIKPVSEPIAS